MDNYDDHDCDLCPRPLKMGDGGKEELRNWFAGMALQGLLANGQGPTQPWVHDEDAQYLVKAAYDIAKAMVDHE